MLEQVLPYAMVLDLNGNFVASPLLSEAPTLDNGGITQNPFTITYKISDKAVSSWERDETIPDFDKLAKLAKLLQIPAAWLLDGAGPPPPPDHLYVRIEALEPAERAMLTAIIDAMPKRRGKVA